MAKLRHTCVFCLRINAAHKGGLDSSLQTPHGERKCFGWRNKGIFERKKKREVCLSIKLSLTFTPSPLICLLLKPFKSLVKGSKTGSCQQKIPKGTRKVAFSTLRRKWFGIVGTGKERSFLGLWLVNLLLSMGTLYSQLDTRAMFWPQQNILKTGNDQISQYYAYGFLFCISAKIFCMWGFWILSL